MNSDFENNRAASISDLKNEDLTLTSSLRPFWKFTYFTGILLDWCVITTNSYKRRKWIITTALRWFIILSSFILIFLLLIYRLSQLVIALREMSSIISITMSIAWFSPLPVAIQIQLFFIFHRRLLFNYFQSFSKIEKRPAFHLPSQRSCLRSARRSIFGILYSSTLCTLIGIVFTTQTYSNEPHFYTGNPYLTSILNSSFLKSVSSLTDFLAIFFLLMEDI